jgi:3-phenylpropionate/trans-cinnamate dioxygenase ferredoxin reductase subunit
MNGKKYKYVIIGAGVAGASAVEGIREVDGNGTILMLGAERDLPYNRPPLSKDLWTGKKSIENIYVHDEPYYTGRNVSLHLGERAVRLDPAGRTVEDLSGHRFSYKKLLLATGGTARKLDVPGGDMPMIFYYRNLKHFMKTWKLVSGDNGRRTLDGSSALVVGGGFIGTEMAAALASNGVDTTMVFPSSHVLEKRLPEGVARSLHEDFDARGVRILTGKKPEAFQESRRGVLTLLEGGESLETDFVIAGIGITPSTALAKDAGLQVADGIVVDDRLRTSNPHIFSAGDSTLFPFLALGKRRRVEHWDNAVAQGRTAGHNMAGRQETYDHIPYFFSDIFDFSYEAVGEVSMSHEILEDWQKENRRGVVYYMHEGMVRGVLMCNLFDRVGRAREILRKQDRIRPEKLQGTLLD